MSQDLVTIQQEFMALGAPEPKPNIQTSLTVTSQPQRDAANELWLRTHAKIKQVKAAIKEFKDQAKAALEAKIAPVVVEQQLLEVMDSALERGIIKYDEAVVEAARKEQERQNKLFEKRQERAEAKAEQTGQAVIVAPPPVVPVPQKTQAVAGVGASTVRVDYTYEIPGCADPAILKRSDPQGEKIPNKHWKLAAPKLHRDDTIYVEMPGGGRINILEYLPLSWFALDLDTLNKAVKSSNGEQIIPGVVIKERKGLAGRLA